MKRLVWLPIAGFLLIAGAAVALAAPTIADNLGAASPSPSDDSGSGSEPGRDDGLGFVTDGNSLLDEVLSDLVTAGTITQDQSDAIAQALTDKARARHAEIEAHRQKMEEMWTQIRGFLEDGVITSDEIAQLPADNPFSNLQDMLSDGQITLDELRSINPLGGFFHHGPGVFGPGGPESPVHHGGPGWLPGPNDDPDSENSSSSNS